MKILLATLLLLPIIFIGCGGENAQILITEAQKDAPDSLLLYPPKVLISGVIPGSKIKAPNLMLQNGTEDTINLVLSVKSPDKVTVDVKTGQTYFPMNLFGAQDILNKLINVEEALKIPPYSVASIPLTIIMPKDIVFPEHWEFDIKVSEAGGFVTTALIQRWLITMER